MRKELRFFDVSGRLPENGPQGSCIKFSMHGDRERLFLRRRETAKLDMTAFLGVNLERKPFKDAQEILAGETLEPRRHARGVRLPV